MSRWRIVFNHQTFHVNSTPTTRKSFSQFSKHCRNTNSFVWDPIFLSPFSYFHSAYKWVCNSMFLLANPFPHTPLALKTLAWLSTLNIQVHDVISIHSFIQLFVLRGKKRFLKFIVIAPHWKLARLLIKMPVRWNRVVFLFLLSLFCGTNSYRRHQPTLFEFAWKAKINFNVDVVDFAICAHFGTENFINLSINFYSQTDFQISNHHFLSGAKTNVPTTCNPTQPNSWWD